MFTINLCTLLWIIFFFHSNDLYILKHMFIVVLCLRNTEAHFHRNYRSVHYIKLSTTANLSYYLKIC